MRKRFKIQRLEFGTCSEFRLDVNCTILTKPEESFIKGYTDIFRSRWIFIFEQIQQQRHGLSAYKGSLAILWYFP